ncbi:MAG TPA: hypothetical protein VH373_19370 [Jatrophihabitantaceae bacterium]|jgi:hypothetical protein
MAKRPVQRPGGHPSIDEVTAERLLRGQRPAPGASATEQALSDLLAAASAPPSARELSGEARAVAAFTATRPATTGPRHARHVIRRRRPAVRPRVGHGVAAAAALGALTLGGVAAAAYTGSLPSSIQRLAHDHIGAPHGAPAHKPAASSTRPQSTHTALRSGRGALPGQPGLSAMTPTPPPTSSSKSQTRPSSSTNSTTADVRSQLCTAYVSARMRGDDAAADKAYQKLADAAGGRDKVWDYCAPVWRTISPSDDHGNTKHLDPKSPSLPVGPVGPSDGRRHN